MLWSCCFCFDPPALELAAVGDGDLLAALAVLGAVGLDLEKRNIKLMFESSPN